MLEFRPWCRCRLRGQAERCHRRTSHPLHTAHQTRHAVARFGYEQEATRHEHRGVESRLVAGVVELERDADEMAGASTASRVGLPGPHAVISRSVSSLPPLTFCTAGDSPFDSRQLHYPATHKAES